MAFPLQAAVSICHPRDVADHLGQLQLGGDHNTLHPPNSYTSQAQLIYPGGYILIKCIVFSSIIHVLLFASKPWGKDTSFGAFYIAFYTIYYYGLLMFMDHVRICLEILFE